MKEGFVFKHDDVLLLKDDKHNLLTVLHENQHGTGANIELDIIVIILLSINLYKLFDLITA